MVLVQHNKQHHKKNCSIAFISKITFYADFVVISQESSLRRRFSGRRLSSPENLHPSLETTLSIISRTISLLVLIWFFRDLCFVYSLAIQTSVTALWWLYNLARFPDVQEKIYQEIQSVVGTDGEVTPHNLTKLHYLKASLKESLRQTFVKSTQYKLTFDLFALFSFLCCFLPLFPFFVLFHHRALTMFNSVA